MTTLRIGIVWASVTIAGCGQQLAAPTGIDQRLGHEDWATAMSIEAAGAGAHPDFNTPSLDGCPFIAPDGLTFYLASNRPGGLGGIDIWTATRPSPDAPWGAPVNVGAPVNSAADDFCPTMSRDGHTLYFVSRRQDGVAGTDWCGGADIYVSRRRDDHGFEAPVNLGCELNSAADEFSPFPVENEGGGFVLYFSSTRPGLGAGGDLYRARRHGGRFGAGVPVPGVNSTADDGQPNVSRDGLELYFYSNRPDPAGQGGNDIYVATRRSLQEEWGQPVNLGPAINSAAAETRPSLSWDGITLYFGSSRPGEGSSDILVSTRRRLTASAR